MTFLRIRVSVFRRSRPARAVVAVAAFRAVPGWCSTPQARKQVQS
jgi:hypothetical protein